MSLVLVAREKYTAVLLPTGAFLFALGRKAWESHHTFKNMYPTILDTDTSEIAAMIFGGTNTCMQYCKCKIWKQGSG